MLRAVSFNVSKTVTKQEEYFVRNARILNWRHRGKSENFQQFRNIMELLHCRISLVFPNTEHGLFQVTQNTVFIKGFAE